MGTSGRPATYCEATIISMCPKCPAGPPGSLGNKILIVIELQ